MTFRKLVGCALFGIFLLFSVNCSDDTEPVDQGVKPDPDMGTDGPQPDKQVPDLPPKVCSLAVAKINTTEASKVTKITAADDQDSTTSGIQIDVTVTGANLKDGTTVKLSVTEVTKVLEAKASSGQVVFKAITIAGTVKQVVINATAAGCVANQIVRSVVHPPECKFVAPIDGASLGKSDDKNTSNTTFDYDVKVAVANATGGTVTLTVDSTSVGSKTLSASGLAVFTDTVLPEGTGKVLEAEVTAGGVTRKCKATVSVDLKGLACKLTFGKSVDLISSLGKLGFGIAQDVKSTTTGLETDVSVKTSTKSTDVVLLVDNSSTKKETTTTGEAKFAEQPLTDGDHTVEATCTETGTTNKGSSGQIKVIVDTVRPSDVDSTMMAIAVEDVRAGKVCLTWTGVGDNTGGSGIDTYNIRYRTDVAVTTTNWDDTATVKAVKDLVAYAKGTIQKYCLNDVPLGSTYYIGIRAADKVKNDSAKVSNFKPVKVDFTMQERTAISGAKAWGAAMASGDFNCDGYSDLAVGNPLEGANNEGTVYIYLGSQNGYLKTPEKVISGTVKSGNFGASLAMLHNFDRDSKTCSDLAIYASHGGGNKATVYVYLGRSDYFDRDDVSTGKGADLIYQLPSPSGAFTRIAGIVSAGDADGDQTTDLAVTYVNGDLTKPKAEAEVWVVFGDKNFKKMVVGAKPVTKDLPGAAGIKIVGGLFAESFGLTMAGGAKINADAYADLLIGAKDKGKGTVYLVTGAARATTLPETLTVGTSKRIYAITGGANNTTFGASVAFVGNMDKGTHNEFAVGDPAVSTGTGAVYIFNVKSGAPKSVADAVATVTHDVTNASGNGFGAVLGDASPLIFKAGLAGVDLNGDGFADLVASSKTKGTGTDGAVYIIKGMSTLTGLATSKAFYTFTKTGATSFGATVIMAPDINGKNASNKSYVDLVIGDPKATSGAGRLFAYY